MIGVIGAEESVALTLEVAAEMGLADQVVGRAYQTASEVPAIARDLDALCHVLLFTGRAPLATAIVLEPALHAKLEVVHHTAIDLYRTLALVMQEHGGEVPRFVVDTIDKAVVAEVCQDLQIAPPIDVLDLETADNTLLDLEEVVDFHVDAAHARDAQLSLTCWGAVNRRLQDLKVPVARIAHTRSTLHHALTRAVLTVKDEQAEGAQAAVALLRPIGGVSRSAGAKRAQAFVSRLRGAHLRLADDTWCVHTNYSALQAFLLAEQDGVPPDWEAGFGVGATLPDAEVNARRALKIAGKGRNVVTVLPDGSVIDLDARATGMRLRETDDLLLAHARDIGLRVLTLTRMTEALRDLDPESLTIREFARAYGVVPRSAARLLAQLEKVGIASVRGVDGAPGAGRPQLVYRVDVDRILPRRSAVTDVSRSSATR